MVDPATPDSCADCYSSGAVDSLGKYALQYGYLEARIHITEVDGKQSAFWMMPESNTTLPGGVANGTANDGAEIDIVKANRQTDRYSLGMHWDGYGATHKASWLEVDAPGIHSNWFNTFSLEWTPTTLKFYYNGTLVRTVSNVDRIPDVPEFPILSGGIFGTTWTDSDITSAALPSWGYVDYIRVYQ